MKQARALLLWALIVATGYAIGLSRGASASTSSAPPPAMQGRYAVTPLGSGQYAILTDTATGSVWYLGFGDYCQGKNPPYEMRQAGYSEQCSDSENSVVQHLPMFQRVSVEGVYKIPLQAQIDSQIYRAAAGAAKTR